jgi:hypothetical protein
MFFRTFGSRRPPTHVYDGAYISLAGLYVDVELKMRTQAKVFLSSATTG